MTGWGQDGPLANAAGHDMNYVALTGLMSLTETPGHPPILPPTVLGDAAGALGLTMGIVAGLLAARSGEGKGCVVDGAIVDVLALLAPLVQLLRKGGALEGTAASVFHDSPFYDRYRCADGRYITVGAIEPQFYALLLEKMGLSDVDPSQQMNRASWPALKVRMTEAFASRSSRHWIRELEGSDACFAPVLTLEEAAKHPHNVSRGLYRLTDKGDIETARGLRFVPLVDQDYLKSPQ
jgi:alpha-methylacyl-CoA racemase